MNATNGSGFSGVWKSLGPGILYAGAAIGTSHLYWSTRAGANYGFALVWVVLLVNLFKYPFFEFCRRYHAATGESALEGYRRVGAWAIYGYLAIAVFSAFVSAAGVTVVTAMLASKFFPWFPPESRMLAWSAILAGGCAALLMAGRYPMLDTAMKAIVAVLAISTVAALFGAATHGSGAAEDFKGPNIWSAPSIIFMVGLMGWMPTPMDAAPWFSLWAKEREKQTGHRASLKEALFDFHLGYVGSTVLALCFLSLGALVMYGTGEKLAEKDSEFAGQLTSLFTKSLGEWSGVLIQVAAFACLFSTLLTVFDGYARSIPAALGAATGIRSGFLEGKWFYYLLLVAFFCGTVFIVKYLMSSIKSLLLFVTVVAFLTAPFLAFVNLRLISLECVPKEARPPVWLRALSWCGLAFLTGFALLFVYSKVFMEASFK